MNNPRIHCLMRYLDRIGYQEISEFLITNKLAVPTDVAAAIHPLERAEFIYHALKKAETDEKLLLVDFQWSILPIEQIKITCVSPREERHFTYGF